MPPSCNVARHDGLTGSIGIMCVRNGGAAATTFRIVGAGQPWRIRSHVAVLAVKAASKPEFHAVVVWCCRVSVWYVDLPSGGARALGVIKVGDEEVDGSPSGSDE